MKVCVVVNALPQYRYFLYQDLITRGNLDLHVYCHSGEAAGLVNFFGEIESYVTVVPYVSAKNERIVISFLPFLKILSEYDVIVVEGNPRYVSHFILATVARLLGKKVVLWTMVHSFRNNRLSKSVRLFWTSIFRKILVYTPCEKKELESFWPVSKLNPMILSINNGVNFRKIQSAIEKNLQDAKSQKESAPVFLSIGRLIPKNQFDNVLSGLALLRDKGFEFKYIVIGSGQEEKILKEQALKLNLDDRVSFAGPLYAEDELAPFFLSADCFLAFTGVGLSILHAMSYALPVITHGNRYTHGPEFCAFSHECSGYLFKEGSVEDFSRVVELFLDDFKLNKDRLDKIGRYNQRIVARYYNVEVMTNNFEKIISH